MYRYYCLDCKWTGQITLIDLKPDKCPKCESDLVVRTLADEL